MSANTGFDNPTLADKARVRAIARGAGKLTLQDERFLQDLWRRCGCFDARNALIVKSIPVLRTYVRRNMSARNIKNDIAYARKARGDRPFGRETELLGEAICGAALASDNGAVKPRGVMGALKNVNDNQGRLLTYIGKEVLGVVCDWNVRELRRGDAGAKDGAPFHAYVSHSAPIAGGDGATYLDVLTDRYDPFEDLSYGEVFDAAISKLDRVDQLVIEARFPRQGRAEPYRKIGERLDISATAVQKRETRILAELRKLVEKEEAKPRPLWMDILKTRDWHTNPPCSRPFAAWQLLSLHPTDGPTWRKSKAHGGTVELVKIIRKRLRHPLDVRSRMMVLGRPDLWNIEVEDPELVSIWKRVGTASALDAWRRSDARVSMRLVASGAAKDGLEGYAAPHGGGYDEELHTIRKPTGYDAPSPSGYKYDSKGRPSKDYELVDGKWKCLWEFIDGKWKYTGKKTEKKVKAKRVKTPELPPSFLSPVGVVEWKKAARRAPLCTRPVSELAATDEGVTPEQYVSLNQYAVAGEYRPVPRAVLDMLIAEGVARPFEETVQLLPEWRRPAIREALRRQRVRPITTAASRPSGLWRGSGPFEMWAWEAWCRTHSFHEPLTLAQQKAKAA